MESETTAAIVIAIIALLVSIMLCGYLYVNQPESTDLSGIQNDISILNNKVINLGKDIDNIDCVVDESDLDDLEYDLKRYCRNEVEDECDCDDGENWYDMSEDEYECLMNSLSVQCEAEDNTGVPHTHPIVCEVEIDFDSFEDCLD